MKTLIIYHSGAGSTKYIANMICKELLGQSDIQILAVEEITDKFLFDDFDNYIIGFPTYHATPSKSIMRMLDKIKLSSEKPAYIYTTCGLYSANTLRIFAKKCIEKNIIPVLSHSFRCPATDGTLITPSIKRWFTFEKGLREKVAIEAKKIISEFKEQTFKAKLPRFKCYSILNYPNKMLGLYFQKQQIHISYDKCIMCGKCSNNCPYKCFGVNNGKLKFIGRECEHCYRCIHHCPTGALSIKKNKLTTKQLNVEFFTNYFESNEKEI